MFEALNEKIAEKLDITVRFIVEQSLPVTGGMVVIFFYIWFDNNWKMIENQSTNVPFSDLETGINPFDDYELSLAAQKYMDIKAKEYTAFLNSKFSNILNTELCLTK